MPPPAFVAIIGLVAILTLWVPHEISYRVLKNRIVRRRRWGLNICCGTTDGGGVNADIAVHAALPKLVAVDIYRLPFRQGEFDSVLCSHTIEHVDNPRAFLSELHRVGRDVVLVLPPLWDLTAALNLLEHQWLFLTLRKEHRKLPPCVRLPGARLLQRVLGQRIHA